MIKLYVIGGLIISVVLMDVEFEKLVYMLEKLEAEIEVVQENMGEVEKKIRTVE